MHRCPRRHFRSLMDCFQFCLGTGNCPRLACALFSRSIQNSGDRGFCSLLDPISRDQHYRRDSGSITSETVHPTNLASGRPIGLSASQQAEHALILSENTARPSCLDLQSGAGMRVCGGNRRQLRDWVDAGSCDMGSFPHELSGYRHISLSIPEAANIMKRREAADQSRWSGAVPTARDTSKLATHTDYFDRPFHLACVAQHLKAGSTHH